MRSPPILPISVAVTSAACAAAITCVELSARTDTTMREADSPNSVAFTARTPGSRVAGNGRRRRR